MSHTHTIFKGLLHSRPSWSLMLVLWLLIGVTVSPAAWAIKKCQDQDGNWHYGDVATQACKQSKITTLDDRGFVKHEQAAPKSAAQLSEEAELRQQQEAEQLRLENEREQRDRILSIYETEDDIIRQRDNQVFSVQSSIDVHQAYIKSLQQRISRHQNKLQTTNNKH